MMNLSVCCLTTAEVKLMCFSPNHVTNPVLNLSRILPDPVPENVRFWIFAFRYLFLKIRH